MNYTISSTKRNLMILSAAFLTVYAVYNAFFFYSLQKGLVKPDMSLLPIRDLLFAVPHIYLLIVLFDYFRYHGWKILQGVVLVAAMVEIAGKIIRWVNVLWEGTKLSSFHYGMIMGLFWAIIILLQAIFLLRLKRKEYPEVFALQKYALALILTQLVAFAIPVIIRSDDSNSMMLVIRIISAVPTLFLIEFALKLKAGKRDLVSDTQA